MERKFMENEQAVRSKIVQDREDIHAKVDTAFNSKRSRMPVPSGPMYQTTNR